MPEMCDPILVTLMKMQPQNSQSSHENASHPAAHPISLLLGSIPAGKF